MKNLILTIGLTLVVFSSVMAQQKEDTFLIAPEMVQIYGYEAATKGSLYEYEFEDDYTVKLTNKVYKINLFFNNNMKEVVQKAVSKILDGEDVSSGYENMVWKRTAQNGKRMYEVELKDSKLYIQVIRKHMNSEGYETLNKLGKAFLKEINS
ncbi:hypothetical protein N9954_05870 [Maribacter sp.]|nr:hypothetical protein [Maribacter sp.]